MASELRFDVTAMDRFSKVLLDMGKAVEKFDRQLDKVDNKRVEAEIDVDTSKAERNVGSFAADMRKRLAAAVKALEKGTFDVALLDIKMPGLTGIEVLAKVRQASPETQVIIMTGHATVELKRYGAPVVVK